MWRTRWNVEDTNPFGENTNFVISRRRGTRIMAMKILKINPMQFKFLTPQLIKIARKMKMRMDGEKKLKLQDFSELESPIRNKFEDHMEQLFVSTPEGIKNFDFEEEKDSQYPSEEEKQVHRIVDGVERRLDDLIQNLSNPEPIVVLQMKKKKEEELRKAKMEMEKDRVAHAFRVMTPNTDKMRKNNNFKFPAEGKKLKKKKKYCGSRSIKKKQEMKTKKEIMCRIQEEEIKILVSEFYGLSSNISKKDVHLGREIRQLDLDICKKMDSI